MSEFSAEFIATAARKPQFYFLLDFSKLKTLGQVLDLFSKIVYQSEKTSSLRALLTRSENTLLGDIFTSLCCNCDTKHACKRSF